MSNKKNIIKVLANTIFGIVLILIWLKLVDIRSVLDHISKVNIISVLPFFLFVILANFFRSLRMKILLSEYKISLKNIFFVNHLGQLLNFIIPLRLGELSKGVYFSTQYNLPFSKSVIWVLLDRFIDFWMILVLALTFTVITPSALDSNMKLILAIVIIVVTTGTVMVVYTPKITKEIVEGLKHILIVKVLKRYFVQFSNFLIDTVGLLRKSFMQTIALLGLTFIALIFDSLTWYIIFLAVFKQVDIMSIFFGSLLSSLTYLVPAAPGYVGSAEASGVAVFGLIFGFDITKTSAVTVLFHLLTLVAILALGISSLYLLKFDLNLVWKKLKRDEKN